MGMLAEVVLKRNNVPLIDEVAEWIELSGAPSLASILDGLREGQMIADEILRYRVQYEEPAAAALRRRRKAESARRRLSLGDGDEKLVSALDPDFSGLGPAPGVSSLALRVSPEPDLCAAVATCHKFCGSGAFIAGAHHNIIALYVGAYRPAAFVHAQGFYLVLDAADDALAAVPPLPPSLVSAFSHRPWTGSAAVRRGGAGGYLLAELVPRIGTAAASLCVWRWPPHHHQQQGSSWEHTDVKLPSPDDFFADAAFAAGGDDDDVLCWADLLMGVLVCEGVVGRRRPIFTFVPLPDGYHVRPDDPVHGRRRGIVPPEHYRCMSSSAVSSSIRFRFVSLDGYRQGWAPSDVVLTAWTLDLSDTAGSGWTKIQAVRIGDVVCSWPCSTPPPPSPSPSSFRASCPLLSAVDDGVVYLHMTQQGPLPGYHVALRNGRVHNFTRAQSTPVAHKLVTSFTAFLNLNLGGV